MLLRARLPLLPIEAKPTWASATPKRRENTRPTVLLASRDLARAAGRTSKCSEIPRLLLLPLPIAKPPVF